MPNLTSVGITFTEAGAAARLKKLVEKAGTGNLCQLVRPMPEVLEGTIAGSRRGRHTRLPDGSEDYIGDVIPFTAAEEKELKKIGFDNWYEWQRANWGIKWGTMGLEIDTRTNSLVFTSPWSEPCLEVFDLLAGMVGSGMVVDVEYESGPESTSFEIHAPARKGKKVAKAKRK